jgi:hypothetical protein
MNGDTNEIHYEKTDSQGCFHFTELHGKGLGIWPQKEGYEYSLRLPSKRPDDYQSNPNNLVVFTMWKLRGAEPMIHDRKFYGMTPDWRTFTVDLVNKKKIEGSNAVGDLLVQIQRPTQIKPSEKFDWSFAMSAIGGGVIEVTNVCYLNEAPENGYQPSYEVNMSATNLNWREEVEKTFYLTSRNGHVYGHFHVTVIPNYNNTSVFKIESYINPSTSRNLEFDPKTQMH